MQQLKTLIKMYHDSLQGTWTQAHWRGDEDKLKIQKKQRQMHGIHKVFQSSLNRNAVLGKSLNTLSEQLPVR